MCSMNPTTVPTSSRPLQHTVRVHAIHMYDSQYSLHSLPQCCNARLTVSLLKLPTYYVVQSLCNSHWHCPHTMWCRVYVTVGCPSICFIDQQQYRHVAGLLLSMVACSKYYSIVASNCTQQQMWVASLWKLRYKAQHKFVTTDLLFYLIRYS